MKHTQRTIISFCRTLAILFSLALFAMLGCDSRPPSVTRTPAPTFTLAVVPPSGATLTAASIPALTPTPTPTPTLTPTPTATPIPPVRLSIEFPKPVTALEPVPIRVLIEEPPDVDVQVDLNARVIDAQDQLYATIDMSPEGRDGWWVGAEELQLPLEPEPYPGVWHLIIDADISLPSKGYRDRVFTPQRVPYHVLTDTLPAGVELRVPQAFAETAAQGNLFAGLRAWSYRDCEISLAWTPGPTEPLLLDNALVMAEALHDPAREISIEASEEMPWGEGEWTAFVFYELWRSSGQSSPSETLVVQGPGFWLYALRIRAQTQGEIHSLCRDVRATLGFHE